MLLGGVLALLNPMAASISAVFLAAWFFLIAGVFQLLAVFTDRGAGNKLFHGLWGAVAIFLAITLLANPLAGMFTLTFAVALVLAISAIIRLVLAISYRNSPAFWGLLVSALVSGVLAFLILWQYPESAMVFLGIYLGVDLLFAGFAFLSLGMTGRRVENTLSG
ncbi:conserved hypothetical protein [Altererythrobacter sp. B11]|nr:conserved hypothetical protein [Altererythrobacter sp. B11]